MRSRQVSARVVRSEISTEQSQHHWSPLAEVYQVLYALLDLFFKSVIGSLSFSKWFFPRKPQYFFFEYPMWHQFCVQLYVSLTIFHFILIRDCQLDDRIQHLPYPRKSGPGSKCLWLFHVVCILCCGSFNLFCSVWVCVCVDFLMCGCVYVWIF